MAEIWARSDLDSLLCCAALRDIGVEGAIEFINPLDVLSGSVRLPVQGWALNVPGGALNRCFDRNCWPGPIPCGGYSTAFEGLLAELGNREVLEKYQPWIHPLKQWATRQYSKEELKEPDPAQSLALICDPLSGLGRNRDFIVSNYFFLLDLAEHLRWNTPEAIIEFPDVRERMSLLKQRRSQYEDQVRRTTVKHHKVLIQDLRGEDILHPGHPYNRFLDFPQATLAVTLTWDKQKKRVAITAGSSLNRGAFPHVGSLLHPFGGGGDCWQGIVQVEPGEEEGLIQALTEKIDE